MEKNTAQIIANLSRRYKINMENPFTICNKKAAICGFRTSIHDALITDLAVLREPKSTQAKSQHSLTIKIWTVTQPKAPRALILFKMPT